MFIQSILNMDDDYVDEPEEGPPGDDDEFDVIEQLNNEDDGDEEEKDDTEEFDVTNDTAESSPTPLVTNETIITNTYIRAPEMRILSPHMTINEMSKILSVRSTQIQNGDLPMIEVPRDDKTGLYVLSNPDDIAREEIRQRKCPLLIIRLLRQGMNGGNVYEVWSVNELTGQVI
jgi:hypothetical protein